MTGEGSSDYPYDVAFSYAGEQREYVEAVARLVKTSGARVFLDVFEVADLWGKDLYQHLDYVYRKASRFCVVFISKDYASKIWTTHERQSAQARALEQGKEYVLPVRFDDTEVPGLRSSISYLRAEDFSAEALAGILLEKLPPIDTSPRFPNSLELLDKKLGIVGPKKRTKAAKESAWNALLSFHEL